MYSKQKGGISWIDLTIENAPQVRDFYSAVIGLEPQDMPMGDYNDFVMSSPEDLSLIHI